MKKHILLMASVLVLGSSLFAQDNPDSFEGSWLFGGFQVGPSILQTDVASELSKRGLHADVKGLYSYYWPSWVVDAGAGWAINWMTGDSSNVPLVEDTVTTRAALLEFNSRYRMSKRWELGIQNKILLGADTHFSTIGSEKSRMAHLIGPEVVYARRDLALPTRFIFSVLTDTNVSDRQVVMALMGVEFGLWGAGKSKKIDAPVALENTEPKSPLSEPGYSREYQEPIVTVTFDLDDIHFEYDRSEVSDQSKKIVEALGQFLSREKSSWRMLRIEGHADNRGPEPYNQSLSEKRSGSVEHILISQGLEKDAVEALGYGETKPKIPEDTELAWAKNRRVEFIFDGVNDPQKFKAAIEDIRDRFGKPEIFPHSNRVSKIHPK